MKLVLYNNENIILEVFEGLEQPIREQDSVTWRDGQLKGIKTNFTILPEEILLGDTLTNEILAKEIMIPKKRDLEEENHFLKERLKAAEDAILSLLTM